MQVPTDADLTRALLFYGVTVRRAAEVGTLMDLLATLPRERWTERCSSAWTLLHYACLGPNEAALVALLAHGLDVNARGDMQVAPAHIAAASGFPRMLALLCAAGANVRAVAASQAAPLDFALDASSTECIQVLVANGVRLRSTQRGCGRITEALVALECGVLRCRDAAVALMALKRRRCRTMQGVDRWVVRELAWACWATRFAKQWMPTTVCPKDLRRHMPSDADEEDRELEEQLWWE